MHEKQHHQHIHTLTTSLARRSFLAGQFLVAPSVSISVCLRVRYSRAAAIPGSNLAVDRTTLFTVPARALATRNPVSSSRKSFNECQHRPAEVFGFKTKQSLSLPDLRHPPMRQFLPTVPRVATAPSSAAHSHTFGNCSLQ